MRGQRVLERRDRYLRGQGAFRGPVHGHAGQLLAGEPAQVRALPGDPPSQVGVLVRGMPPGVQRGWHQLRADLPVRARALPLLGPARAGPAPPGRHQAGIMHGRRRRARNRRHLRRLPPRLRGGRQDLHGHRRVREQPLRDRGCGWVHQHARGILVRPLPGRLPRERLSAQGRPRKHPLQRGRLPPRDHVQGRQRRLRQDHQLHGYRRRDPHVRHVPRRPPRLHGRRVPRVHGHRRVRGHPVLRRPHLAALHLVHRHPCGGLQPARPAARHAHLRQVPLGLPRRRDFLPLLRGRSAGAYYRLLRSRRRGKAQAGRCDLRLRVGPCGARVRGVWRQQVHVGDPEQRPHLQVPDLG
mmetsp:Transcript_24103/g.75551  ORF Transcript_24103/g.75551 Transcript_24103/m.75551 type:complete len:354 (-) Transcript_24103:2779-3840(-)